MFQRVIIAGNLGSDPVMRYMSDGTPVTTFSVATNEVRSDRESGERKERTTWWRVTVWRKQAEVCNQYLSKGRQVLVEGTMTVDPETGAPRIWTGQDGKPRASLELTAQTVRFIGGGKGSPIGAEHGDLPPASEEDLPF